METKNKLSEAKESSFMPESELFRNRMLSVVDTTAKLTGATVGLSVRGIAILIKKAVTSALGY